MLAMISFRDPAAVTAAMQSVLSGNVALADGFLLLLVPGQASPNTRKMAFEFLKAHLEEIMKNHPSIFGNDLGSLLPLVGQSFCDLESRIETPGLFRTARRRVHWGPTAASPGTRRCRTYASRARPHSSPVSPLFCRSTERLGRERLSALFSSEAGRQAGEIQTIESPQAAVRRKTDFGREVRRWLPIMH